MHDAAHYVIPAPEMNHVSLSTLRQVATPLVATVLLPVLVVPAWNTVKDVVTIVIAVVPLFTIVSAVPIGKATEALVGMVML